MCRARTAGRIRGETKADPLAPEPRERLGCTRNRSVVHEKRPVDVYENAANAVEQR